MSRYLLAIIPGIVLADTTITLDKQQLGVTQQQIKQSGDQAVTKIPETKKDLSTIKLNQLNLAPVQSEIKSASPIFKNKATLSNKLPDGQKYYLFSESIVSDSKQSLAQYGKGPIDINQTISDYNALIKNAKIKLGDSRLLIFISSSMPKQTIINLMQQSSSLGAVFVVRGLMNGSYVNTYRYFYSLKGNSSVGIMLNPTLFKAMQIETVPTFALYQSEQDLMHSACNITPKYTKVSGDVSVHYAMEQLNRSKYADLAQIAANELDILDNNNFYRKHK